MPFGFDRVVPVAVLVFVLAFSSNTSAAAQLSESHVNAPSLFEQWSAQVASFLAPFTKILQPVTVATATPPRAAPRNAAQTAQVGAVGVTASTRSPAPKAPATTTTATVHRRINQPIIERIIERAMPPVVIGVTEAQLNARLQQLNNKFTSQLAALSAAYAGPSPVPASGGVWNAIALTNRIDQLSGVSITDATVNGRSGLTDADIPDGITASNYLPLIGGTLSGDLTLTGNLTVSGAQTLSGAVTIPYVVATSTSNDSSFVRLTATNATTTNATSTGLFSTFGRFTTGIIDAFTSAAATITNLVATTITGTNATYTNATTTNATSTNFFSTTASSTNIFSTNATLGSTTIGTLHATDIVTTGPMIDVRAYGAVGNGTHDDTAGIQAALNSVPASGGEVYFPCGSYLISNALTVKSKTKVSGNGYCSQILVTPSGWNLSSTAIYGALELYNVSNVEISSIRITGTLTQFLTTTPKLVYFEGATDINIHDSFFENSGFEGLWQGGTEENTQRISIVNNNLTNIGHGVNNTYVGLPAIQMNAVEVLISGNQLTNVGTGIGASGYKIRVIGNRINGVTVDGIGTGDGGTVDQMIISGNSIEMTQSTAGVLKGIDIGGGNSTINDVLVEGNYCSATGSVGNRPRCISGNTGLKATIIGNDLHIQGAGNGILIYGSTTGSNYTVSNNTVYLSSGVEALGGIAGVPNGSGKTLTVISSGNRVFGGVLGNGDFSYDYNANGGGTLTAYNVSDFSSGGAIRNGYANVYYGSGQSDNVPFNLPNNISVPSNLGVGTTTPGSLLSVQGVANFGTATSTFYSTGGISLTAGCFAVSGNCLSLSSLGGTLAVTNGGTGSTTLSGILKGNGTSQVATAIGGTDYEFPLTFSTGLTRSTNTITLNTGNANSWTGLQQFSNASTSLFSAYGPAYFGGSATSSFSAAGILTLASALTVGNGGTGANTFGQGWIFSSGGTGALAASTSPTVNYITATSTTATSTFAGGATFATGGGNFGVGTSSPVAPFSIANTAYFAGNVGIRTATPSAGLQLLSAASTYANKTLKVMDGSTNSTITVTGDGRVFLGADSGRNSVLDVNFAGTKTSGNLITYNDGTYTVTQSTSGISSSNPSFGVGGNNFGDALRFTSPASNGMIFVNGANTTIGQQNTGTTPNKTLRVVNAVAVTGVTSFRVQEGAGQSTSEVFGVYANDDTTARLVVQNGNLGIATTSPWRTLSVNGTVGFDGLTGTTGAGSLCLSANKEVVYNSGSDNCLSSLRSTKHDIQPLDLTALDMVKSLQPVSFTYNNDASSTVRYGFIAEDTASVDPHLATHDANGAISGVDDRALLAIVVEAVQGLIDKVAAFADSFTTKELTFTRATGDEIDAKKLCLQKSDGTNVCVTGDQLAAAIAGASSPGSPPSSSATSPDTTPPAITINGDNPAMIHIGDSYNDLGATITGPQADLNLGIKTYLNGTLVSDIVIDTSATATDTVDYVATDQNGLTATSTRQVVIQPLSPPATI
jgi:hypothetical protein